MKNKSNEKYILNLGNSVFKSLPQTAQNWLKKNLLEINETKHINQIYDQMSKKIDVGQLVDLYNAALPEIEEYPTTSKKYFDHKTYLKKNIRRAVRLGWHTRKNMRILDIGCGPGWLLAVGKHLGHDVAGLELPLAEVRETDRFVYTKIPEILQCSNRIYRSKVESFSPLPFSGPFDFMSCVEVCFDGNWDKTPWRINEWKFFLDDADRLLAPGGKLYLSLNRKPSVHEDYIYYDKETLELFKSRGDVKEKKILITKALA